MKNIELANHIANWFYRNGNGVEVYISDLRDARLDGQWDLVKLAKFIRSKVITEVKNEYLIGHKLYDEIYNQ